MGAKKITIDKDWFKSESKASVRKISKFEQVSITKSEDLPELMSAKEAAVFLKRHYKTIEEWRKDGQLKFMKVRGRYFTTPEFIADFLDNEQKKNG